jgi:hypothetical protein
MRGLIVILIALAVTPAMAKTPWYAGAGIGATNYRAGSALDNAGVEGYQLDDWESGFQLFGGYQLNEQWAVEVGYIDFGKGTASSDCALGFNPPGGLPPVCLTTGTIDVDTAGAYVNGQYHIPIADSVSLDLQGGWLFGKAEATKAFPNTVVADPVTKFDDNGAMLGLAFSWHGQSGFGVRGAVNYFVVDYDNAIKKPWRLGIDLLYNF